MYVAVWTTLLTVLLTVLLTFHIVSTHAQSVATVPDSDNGTSVTKATFTMTTTASTTTKNESDTQLDVVISAAPATKTDLPLLICLVVDCPETESNSKGSHSVEYADDCTPYLNVSCGEGYTRTNDIYYCINEEWVPPINDVLCAKNCGPLTVPPNTDAFHAVNYSLLLDTDRAFPSGSEVIYQCMDGTIAENSEGSSSLPSSVCRDGEWAGPEEPLDCVYVAPMACQDQGPAVIILGIFCGLQALIIVFLALWFFKKWRSIDKGDKVHNAEIRANPYTTRTDAPPAPRPARPVALPRGPPPRPPARTDTAVVGEDTSAYYAYADVQNGNHIVLKENGGSDKNGEKSIPAYLEIIN